jgi:uncharacterized protein (TIGR02001 family)
VTARAEITGTMTMTSDYRFRGLSFSDLGPAVQGGVEVDSKSGLYAGLWNSSIYGRLQSDLYLGVAKEYSGIRFNIGSVGYFFSRESDSNTNELYLGVGYGILTLQANQSVTDYLGIDNTKGTRYYSLVADIPLGKSGFFVNGKVGYTDFKNIDRLNYYDYRLGVSKELSDWTFSLDYYTNKFKSRVRPVLNFAADTLGERRVWRDGAAISITRHF